MAYVETQNLQWGTITDTSTGNTWETGKYYIQHTELVTPDVDKTRPRPPVVAPFSDAHTSRVYYTLNRTWSDWGERALPGSSYLERLPVAYHGGNTGVLILDPPYDLNVRLALKIKDQKANLGITLAKYRELCTIWSAMAGSILTVGQSLQRIKNPRNWMKGRRKRLHPAAGALVKGAAGVYLGYLFGYRQFAKDFDATSEALRRRFEDPMYLSDHFSLYDRDTISWRQGSGESEVVAECVGLQHTRVKFRYRVIPNEQVLAQMGMTNPLATVYDFIPFSFVLNWMIPIGRHIAALDALVGVEDLRWYYTVRDTSEVWAEYPHWNKAAGSRFDQLSRSGLNKHIGAMPLPRPEMSKFASNVLTGVALLAGLSKHPNMNSGIIRIR